MANYPAGRRIRTRAGRLVAAGPRRLGQRGRGIRDQAVPRQPDPLGILPFTITAGHASLQVGDRLFLAGVRRSVLDGDERFTARVLRDGHVAGEIESWLRDLTATERQVLAAGSLINYNRSRALAG